MTAIVDGRYRLDTQLAVGGFGAVYRATDLQLGRTLALKILHRELANNPSIVARFHREAVALAKLKSPHTVTIYDIGQTSDAVYLVMELLRGETLADVLARTECMPWRRAVRIARGVCSSLREAHALGIVHRDLKPANIFLERHVIAGELVKVVDFGIAKSMVSNELAGVQITLDGQTIGTFDYMAPEQLVGEPCTPACDVFTLGVVMYEMIAGTRPFGAARNPAQMLVALATERPRPLTNVPGALAQVVQRCLSRDACDRPSIAQVDAILESVLVGELAISDEATIITPALGASGLGHHGLALSAPARANAIAVRRTLPRSVAMPVRARGSDNALAFAPTVAGTPGALTYDLDNEVTAVTAPPVHEPASRGRLAEGTGADQLLAPRRDEMTRPGVAARDIVRYLTLALCLFALGFAVAFAVWSM